MFSLKSPERVRGAVRIARQPSKLKVVGSNPIGPATPYFTMLCDFILKRKPDLGPLKNEIRLICVVNRVQERVKNACFSIDAPVSIFSYSIFKENDGALNVILRKEIDTELEKIAIPKQNLGKNEMLAEYPALAPIYLEMEKYTKNTGQRYT